MNKIILIFITFLVFASCIKPPEKEFNTDDEIIAGNPLEIINNLNYQNIELEVSTNSHNFDNSIEDLSDFFLSHFVNEDDRVYAIYYWIITNISYDYELANSTFVLNESTEKIVKRVFNNRKGVCDGYSRLFCVFCDNTNLKSAYIDGFTPSNNMNLQDPLLYGMHAWNAIRINEEWYLLDTTWSWFLTEPIEFYNQHIPYDDKWKLF